MYTLTGKLLYRDSFTIGIVIVATIMIVISLLSPSSNNNHNNNYSINFVSQKKHNIMSNIM